MSEETLLVKNQKGIKFYQGTLSQALKEYDYAYPADYEYLIYQEFKNKEGESYSLLEILFDMLHKKYGKKIAYDSKAKGRLQALKEAIGDKETNGYMQLNSDKMVWCKKKEPLVFFVITKKEELENAFMSLPVMVTDELIGKIFTRDLILSLFQEGDFDGNRYYDKENNRVCTWEFSSPHYEAAKEYIKDSMEPFDILRTLSGAEPEEINGFLLFPSEEAVKQRLRNQIK